jgi:Carboxypeptidase regulatory-like domain
MMKLNLKALITRLTTLTFVSLFIFPVLAFSQQNQTGALSLLLLSGDNYANTGSIYGQVKSTNGSNLFDVQISVSGQVATRSNLLGYFSVPGIAPAERVVVTFSKEGYVSTTANVRIQANQITYIDPVMGPNGTTGNYSGNELTLSHNGGQIVIPAGSLVDSSGTPFSGPATAAFTVFDPTMDAERNAFPGDFIGHTSSGQDIPFLSYGFFDITVKDSAGNKLQLAPGRIAEFSIPIPASILATAPVTMPLWYFNEANGRWEEKGTVTKAGNFYVGSVPHFSVWNNDVGYNRSYVTGRVVCNGVPVQGARVTFKGISPRNCWDSGESSTPPDGTFYVPVDANSVVEYWVKKDTFQTTPVQFTSLDTDGVLNLGDIQFCPILPAVVFTLSWGENPHDLDSHLLTPSGAHIAYYNKTEDGAALDYDDVTSYGPEHITITTLNDGDYFYSVHWFSGTGTWGTSGAIVVMTIDGVGSYTLGAPSAGDPATTRYWNLWKLTVQGGQVTNVTTLNSLSDGFTALSTMGQTSTTLPIKDAQYLEQHK